MIKLVACASKQRFGLGSWSPKARVSKMFEIAGEMFYVLFWFASKMFLGEAGRKGCAGC